MIIVKKRRGRPVVFILIAVNVLLVCVSLFILFWPTRPSSKRGATNLVETQTEDSAGTRTKLPLTPASPGENEAFLTMRVEQVYAHNATRLYYPERCPQRPEKAYKIARSLAIKQGFTLAPNCTEQVYR